MRNLPEEICPEEVCMARKIILALMLAMYIGCHGCIWIERDHDGEHEEHHEHEWHEERR